MEIELGRIYTTMGDSIALPMLKYNDKVDAFVLYAADKASVYSPMHALYDSYTGQCVRNDSSLDLYIPVYSLNVAEGIMDKVLARGWRQAETVTANAAFWDAKLACFIDLFRKVY